MVNELSSRRMTPASAGILVWAAESPLMEVAALVHLHQCLHDTQLSKQALDGDIVSKGKNIY